MKKFLLSIVGLVVINLFLLIKPDLLFAEKYEYRGFTVFSDQHISSNITNVLDDAIERLEKSELYFENSNYNLYLCNSQARFSFFTRSPNAGGVVNFFLSSNIFIRSSDIENNSIIPPSSWKNPLDDRPLSYFIAHEAVHSLQRNHDWQMIFNAPTEILEGYAEYVAKSTTNDLERLIQDYKEGNPKMDPSNGLYDKYNLYVTYLFEKEGFDFQRLLSEQPSIEEVLRKIE